MDVSYYLIALTFIAFPIIFLIWEITSRAAVRRRPLNALLLYFGLICVGLAIVADHQLYVHFPVYLLRLLSIVGFVHVLSGSWLRSRRQ
jgi:peptidoglycan/LPS O-acetylase OafA/YrhL